MIATGGLAAFSRLSAQDLDDLGTATHQRLTSTAGAAPFLTPGERLTVAAAAECIIPRTDTPGATDARVAEFADVMLAEWYPAADAARFRDGLASLDATSRGRFRTSFADASPTNQVELVQALDDEVASLRTRTGNAANAHWFAMLKYLTVWGFCTSEPGMRDLLKSHPRPLIFDGAAPLR
jgi:hypothetical protein